MVASDTRGQHGGAGFRVRTRSPLTNALDLLGSTRGEYRRVVSYQPSTPVALCEAPTGWIRGKLRQRPRFARGTCRLEGFSWIRRLPLRVLLNVQSLTALVM